MKIIHTKHPVFTNEMLDAILKSEDETELTDLELIDELIRRAKETGVELTFNNESGRTLSLQMAYRLRYERGLDIR